MRTRGSLLAVGLFALVTVLALSPGAGAQILPSVTPLPSFDITATVTPTIPPHLDVAGEELVGGGSYVITGADGTQYRVYEQTNRILGTGPTPTPPPTIAPPPSLIAYDDSTFTYFGTWTAYVAPAPNVTKYGVGDHYTSIPGSAYGFLFTGTGVRLVGSMAPWLGIAAVKLDDGPLIDVDLYHSPGSLDQQITWDSGPLTDGVHRILVYNTGRKNPAAQSIQINGDRADIIGGALIAPLAP